MNTEALIAEYTSLKEELINLSNNRNTLFIFAFTSVGAVLSFALQTQNAYISLIAFFILLCVKCRIIYYRDTYYQKFAYMRLVLEPKLHLDSTIQRKIKVFGISKIQYFTFSFMGVGCVLALVLIDPCNRWGIIFALIMLVIIIGLDCYYLFGSEALYSSIEKQYEES